jgi:hypothetical protein
MINDFGEVRQKSHSLNLCIFCHTETKKSLRADRFSENATKKSYQKEALNLAQNSQRSPSKQQKTPILARDAPIGRNTPIYADCKYPNAPIDAINAIYQTIGNISDTLKQPEWPICSINALYGFMDDISPEATLRPLEGNQNLQTLKVVNNASIAPNTIPENHEYFCVCSENQYCLKTQ